MGLSPSGKKSARMLAFFWLLPFLASLLILSTRAGLSCMLVCPAGVKQQGAPNYPCCTHQQDQEVTCLEELSFQYTLRGLHCMHIVYIDVCQKQRKQHMFPNRVLFSIQSLEEEAVQFSSMLLDVAVLFVLPVMHCAGVCHCLDSSYCTKTIGCISRKQSSALTAVYSIQFAVANNKLQLLEYPNIG